MDGMDGYNNKANVAEEAGNEEHPLLTRRVWRRGKYRKETVRHVLHYLRDDDFFFRKRTNWEDWVIARVDVANALAHVKGKGLFGAENVARYLNNKGEDHGVRNV